MKVLICGSRGWTDQAAIWDRLRNLPLDAEIITGGAIGVDTIAKIGADYFGLTSIVFPADWKTHGKAAGLIRNIEMLDQKPDLVIAFWDGKSTGTAHTITNAEKRTIPVEVITA